MRVSKIKKPILISLSRYYAPYIVQESLKLCAQSCNKSPFLCSPVLSSSKLDTNTRISIYVHYYFFGPIVKFSISISHFAMQK